jgi:hypothetical protein
MTTATIETAARRRLNAASSTFWSSTEIIEDCLYFALVDLCNRAKCYETSSTATSVVGTAGYTKPTSAIDLKYVEYDGQPLELTTKREIYALNLNGTAAPLGRPTHYYLWGSSYYLYPTPDEALTITLFYTSGPGAITSGSTIPVPLQFQSRLVNGVAYYMLLKETDDPRIPVFEKRWFDVDIPWCVDEWIRLKNAGKAPRVRLEETLLTTDTGMV